MWSWGTCRREKQNNERELLPSEQNYSKKRRGKIKKDSRQILSQFFFYSMHCYRETEPKAQIGLETEKMCNFLVTCILHYFGLSINIYTKKNTFLLLLFSLFSALNSSFLGCSHAGSLFTNEERERLVRYVIYTFCNTFRPCSYRLLGTKITALTVVFTRLLNADF